MPRPIFLPPLCALLLVLLAFGVGGCGGETTLDAFITSRDVGSWRGTATGYTTTTQEQPQVQNQTANVTLQVQPDKSFTAALQVTTYKPESTDVESVRDGTLSGTVTSGFEFKGSLTIAGSAYPVSGSIRSSSRFNNNDGTKTPTLQLDYTYADGRTWYVHIGVDRAP